MMPMVTLVSAFCLNLTVKRPDFESAPLHFPARPHQPFDKMVVTLLALFGVVTFPTTPTIPRPKNARQKEKTTPHEMCRKAQCN